MWNNRQVQGSKNFRSAPFNNLAASDANINLFNAGQDSLSLSGNSWTLSAQTSSPAPGNAWQSSVQTTPLRSNAWPSGQDILCERNNVLASRQNVVPQSNHVWATGQNTSTQLGNVWQSGRINSTPFKNGSYSLTKTTPSVPSNVWASEQNVSSHINSSTWTSRQDNTALPITTWASGQSALSQTNSKVWASPQISSSQTSNNTWSSPCVASSQANNSWVSEPDCPSQPNNMWSSGQSDSNNMWSISKNTAQSSLNNTSTSTASVTNSTWFPEQVDSLACNTWQSGQEVTSQTRNTWSLNENSSTVSDSAWLSDQTITSQADNAWSLSQTATSQPNSTWSTSTQPNSSWSSSQTSQTCEISTFSRTTSCVNSEMWSSSNMSANNSFGNECDKLPGLNSNQDLSNVVSSENLNFYSGDLYDAPVISTMSQQIQNENTPQKNQSAFPESDSRYDPIQFISKCDLDSELLKSTKCDNISKEHIFSSTSDQYVGVSSNDLTSVFESRQATMVQPSLSSESGKTSNLRENKSASLVAYSPSAYSGSSSNSLYKEVVDFTEELVPDASSNYHVMDQDNSLRSRSTSVGGTSSMGVLPFHPSRAYDNSNFQSDMQSATKSPCSFDQSVSKDSLMRMASISAATPPPVSMRTAAPPAAAAPASMHTATTVSSPIFPTNLPQKRKLESDYNDRNAYDQPFSNSAVMVPPPPPPLMFPKTSLDNATENTSASPRKADNSESSKDLETSHKTSSQNEETKTPSHSTDMGESLSNTFLNLSTSCYSPVGATPDLHDMISENNVSDKVLSADSERESNNRKHSLPMVTEVSPKLPRLDVDASETDEKDKISTSKESSVSSTSTVTTGSVSTPAIDSSSASVTPMSESEAKAALFAALLKCKVTSEDDAKMVLQVISSLTEAYMRYKLHFMPKTKFESLIKSVREGKEKETNFILRYLGTEARSKATDDDDAASSLVASNVDTASENKMDSNEIDDTLKKLSDTSDSLNSLQATNKEDATGASNSEIKNTDAVNMQQVCQQPMMFAAPPPVMPYWLPPSMPVMNAMGIPGTNQVATPKLPSQPLQIPFPPPPLPTQPPLPPPQIVALPPQGSTPSNIPLPAPLPPPVKLPVGQPPAPPPPPPP